MQWNADDTDNYDERSILWLVLKLRNKAEI